MREHFGGQRDDFKAFPHPSPLLVGEGTDTQTECESTCACVNSIINSYKLSTSLTQIYSGLRRNDGGSQIVRNESGKDQ
jgi:hypothetical protein